MPLEPLSGAPAKGDKGTAAKKLAPQDAGKDGESDDDGGAEATAVKSVAQEISGGMRVEDIVEPPSDYRYAAFGRPDPFLPPMVTQQELARATTGGAPGVVDPLEIPIIIPLQRFALSDLNLIGIWQLSSGECKAMIMTPGAADSGGGRGHRREER